MPFIEAKCTNCGAVLPVDKDRDAWVCGYCGTPFIVEKAVNLYNTTNNIKADTVNIYGTKDFEIRGGVLLKYNGEAQDVVVPDGVVEIEGAFSGCAGVRNIVLPDSVEVIGGAAFDGCARLQSITMPKGLREIRWRAFRLCSQLQEITIPDNIEKVHNAKANEKYQKYAEEMVEYQRKLQTEFDSYRRTSIQDGITLINRCLDEILSSAVFSGCSNLSIIHISDACYHRIDGDAVFLGTPFLAAKLRADNQRREAQQQAWQAQQQAQWKQLGLCQYCGGKIAGILDRQCKSCGRPKDY